MNKPVKLQSKQLIQLLMKRLPLENQNLPRKGREGPGSNFCCSYMLWLWWTIFSFRQIISFFVNPNILSLLVYFLMKVKKGEIYIFICFICLCMFICMLTCSDFICMFACLSYFAYIAGLYYRCSDILCSEKLLNVLLWFINELFCLLLNVLMLNIHA